MIKNKDYVQQLSEYIKKNLSKGYTLDSLRWSLINQGYSRTAVERAITLTNEQLARTAPKMQEKPHIIYEVIDEPHNSEKIPEKKSFWKRLFR